MSVSFLAENKTMQTIRARVAFHSRQHGFDKCMQQIAHSEHPVNVALITELYAFWGDPLTPADEQFLRSCLAEVNAAQGPVLLAGASLLTLILGAICDRDPARDKQVWCLESDRHWANLIRSWLTEYRVNGAHVIQSPARMFQDHVWYSVDTARLAKSYRLIICDGSAATPEGVMGAVRQLDALLTEPFTLLARNVRDVAALRSLSAWAKEHETAFALIDKQAGFIKLSRRAESRSDGMAPGPARPVGARPPTEAARLPAKKPAAPGKKPAAAAAAGQRRPAGKRSLNV